MLSQHGSSSSSSSLYRLKAITTLRITPLAFIESMPTHLLLIAAECASTDSQSTGDVELRACALVMFTIHETHLLVASICTDGCARIGKMLIEHVHLELEVTVWTCAVYLQGQVDDAGIHLTHLGSRLLAVGTYVDIIRLRVGISEARGAEDSAALVLNGFMTKDVLARGARQRTHQISLGAVSNHQVRVMVLHERRVCERRVWICREGLVRRKSDRDEGGAFKMMQRRSSHKQKEKKNDIRKTFSSSS
jgi:hypothetical protein